MSCFRSGIVRKQFRTPYTRTKILSTLSVADFTLLKEDWSGFFDDCFFLIFTNVDEAVLRRPSFKSGQRWRHTPEQCVAASTSRRYSFSLRLPSPRQTPGPQCPHPSDRTPPDANMKRVGAPSTWTSPSDLDKKESDGRHPPQGVAPHAHRGVVGAPELCRWLVSDQPPWVPGH